MDRAGGGFTLNLPKKDSPHYNRVLRIYLSGTRIYNADINRPYGSGLSSIDPSNKSEIKGNAEQLIRTMNFVSQKLVRRVEVYYSSTSPVVGVDEIHNN